MTTIITVNLFVFVIVAGIGMFKGLDLKKWSSWLFALYGFVTAFLCGFLRQDDNGSLKLLVNWTGSLQLGALFAFAVMYAGAMNRWHRQRFAKASPDE
jgi:hypothetical protein